MQCLFVKILDKYVFSSVVWSRTGTEIHRLTSWAQTYGLQTQWTHVGRLPYL